VKQKLIELKSKEFSDYRYGVHKESSSLIKKIIENDSPVQVGDTVMMTGRLKGQTGPAKIVRIELLVKGRRYPARDMLTFAYWGAPLKKDGTMMRCRNYVLIENFIKDDIEYSIPGYFKLKVIPAKMYEACELFGSIDWKGDV